MSSNAVFTFIHDIAMVFIPEGAARFILDNIALESFYVAMELTAIVGLLIFVGAFRKHQIIIYAVALFMLLDSFMMWRADTYFSDRYTVDPITDVRPAVSLIKEVRSPQRLHVIFPSQLFDEGAEAIWRGWDPLITGNMPLYYRASLLSGMALSLVPRYITSFERRFGLNFDADEADVDFSKVSLLGVSKVLLLKKNHKWNADFDLKMEGNGFQIYETSKAGPRFYLTEQISPFVFDWKGSDIDPRFDSDDYDPVSISFVAEEDIDANMKPFLDNVNKSTDGLNSVSYGNGFFESRAGRLTLKKYDWEQVDFVADILKPSLMVLTDSWYPGWKVFVDSEEKPLVRVNYIFRGVWLSPGNHKLSFRYENKLVSIGRLISAIGLLLLVAWSFHYRYTRPR